MNRSRIAHSAELVRRAWLLVGGTLVALMVIDLASSLVLNVFRAQPDEADARARADAYAGATWTDAYFSEFMESGHVRWEPYVYWRRPPYTGKYINVDADGFRRTWMPEHPTTMTIFMFGGSTMWGTGARDDFTIPSLVAKQLSTRGISARVVNFGESGYVSTQELIALERALQQGARPDAVVFYDGVNDPFPAMQMGVAGIPQNEFNRRREFNILDPTRRADLLAEVFTGPLSPRQTATYRLASALIRRVGLGKAAGQSSAGAASSLSPSVVADVVRIYRANVRSVEALATAYGFQAAFYLQPAVFSKQRLTDYERARLNEVAADVPAYLRVYDAIRSDGDLSTDPRFHDLSDIFGSDGRPYFIDAWHLSEDGNAVIAGRMLTDVQRP